MPEKYSQFKSLTQLCQLVTDTGGLTILETVKETTYINSLLIAFGLKAQ
jgi:hypothetical protein